MVVQAIFGSCPPFAEIQLRLYVARSVIETAAGLYWRGKTLPLCSLFDVCTGIKQASFEWRRCCCRAMASSTKVRLDHARAQERPCRPHRAGIRPDGPTLAQHWPTMGVTSRRRSVFVHAWAKSGPVLAQYWPTPRSIRVAQVCWARSGPELAQYWPTPRCREVM